MPPLVAPIPLHPVGPGVGGVANTKRKLFSPAVSCASPKALKVDPSSLSPVTPSNSLLSAGNSPDTLPKRNAAGVAATPSSKRRISRKLAFDEDKSSPVSGTIIRELAEGEEIPVIKTG